MIERERGRRLEERGVEARDERAEGLDAVHDVVFGDRPAVDADALAKRDEMRRGVEAGAAARGLEDRGEHRATIEPLPLVPPTWTSVKRLLGLPERVEQRLDALEARAHARRARRRAGARSRATRLGVRSGGGPSGRWPAKKARRRRRVSAQLAALDDQVEHAVLEQELRALEALGQLLTDRLAMTRGPAKPMSARGSARMTSPSMAKLAVTPPVVGSVRTEMYGSRASPSRASAAEVLAICISERMPSCMRAPPEAETMSERHALARWRARSRA